MKGPDVKGNPLKIAVGLLISSYIIGDFLLPKYPIAYFFNLIGVIGIIASSSIFIAAFSLFKSCEENPLPKTSTNNLIKTGIFAYTRNPIYLSFKGLLFLKVGCNTNNKVIVVHTSR